MTLEEIETMTRALETDAPCICVECGRKFFVFLLNAGVKGWKPLTPARSKGIHKLDPAGMFCTLRCAAAYGSKVARWTVVVPPDNSRD